MMSIRSRLRIAAASAAFCVTIAYGLKSSSKLVAFSHQSDVDVKYSLLKEKLEEIAKLEGVKSLLGWDEMVLLPPEGSTARNDQKSTLSGVIYEKKISSELDRLIKDINNDSDLQALPSPYERAVVRDAARELAFTIRKSKDMTMREAALEGKGYQVWADSRKNNLFSTFSPVLAEIIALKKEIGACTHPHLSNYNANIDNFERGMLDTRLNEILYAAKKELTPLIKNIKSSPVKSNYIPPTALASTDQQANDINWPIEKQKEFSREIAESIGFNFKRGRLDVSVHPFTQSTHPTDVRITTRYSTNNWLQGIAGTVHEVGHALYEQGRNSKYNNLPVAQALSMGVHESQSLFWEKMIFQSREFWEWATPILHKHFPHTKDCTADDLYVYVNQVSPGLIRVDADEVTYPLHIILRFELERCLFDGSISVDDLPLLWKEKMKETLGVEVDSDAKGPLQDIHWALGAFGYFPSYTLGAMMAAQLFETAQSQIPDLKGKISRGEFTELRQWLQINIHEVGSLYDSPDALLVAVTGKPLDPTIYVNYIKQKYHALYKL